MTEKTFLGYERPNGYAGARNYVLIMPINRSLNFIASNVAKMTRGTRHFEIPAETGRPAKDRETIARTMAGLMNNPNVGCILLMAVKPSSSSAYRNMSDVRFIEEAKKTGKPLPDKSKKRDTPSAFPLNSVVEGNFGGEVATSYLYRLSASYMDVIMRNGKKNSSINYFNCSDGAKLKEASPVHSEDLDWWLDLPDIDTKKFIDYIDNEKTLVLEADEAKIKEMCDQTVLDLVIELIVKVLKGEDRPKTRLDYVFMLQTVCEILNKVRETRDYYVADFIDGSLYSMFTVSIEPSPSPPSKMSTS